MKIFYKKKDALKYLSKTNDINLGLFQEDINENGSKRFIISKAGEIYDKINIKKQSHYYESWDKNDNLYFSLDIDINIEKKQKINLLNIIYNNISSVIYYLKKFYNHILKLSDIIVLKTDKQTKKYSVHIIFKGIYFENHLVCKNFYERMIKEKKK